MVWLKGQEVEYKNIEIWGAREAVVLLGTIIVKGQEA